jgi:D-alanyl-lipoteichoic acid acyltransferase DltB (MBOAT superfamily)
MSASLLSPVFWVACLGGTCALSALRTRRNAAFGALNFLVLGVWLGGVVAIGAACLALALWAVLRIATKGEGKTGPILALSAVVLLFLVHKTNVDYQLFSGPRFEAGLGVHAARLMQILAALSLSYVALRAVDMGCSVLLRGSKLAAPLSCMGFLFPFHMLISGPVNSYEEHLKADETSTPLPTLERALEGINHVVTGLVYKYVVAEYMRLFWFGAGPLRVESVIDTAFLLLYTFFDFAGYSLVALGVGVLLGVPTPRNFRTPFLARTATDFFTRWHASLGGFIQRNIYTPLQLHLVRRWGVKQALKAGIVCLSLSWVAVGLWHRLTPRFFLYGLLMATWIWLEKLARDRAIKAKWQENTSLMRLGAVLGPLYVFLTLTAMLHLVAKEIWL